MSVRELRLGRRWLYLVVFVVFVSVFVVFLSVFVVLVVVVFSFVFVIVFGCTWLEGVG